MKVKDFLVNLLFCFVVLGAFFSMVAVLVWTITNPTPLHLTAGFVVLVIFASGVVTFFGD